MAIPDPPGSNIQASITDGVRQVLWPLYHRSVRMYGLGSETNRRSGSAAKVRLDPDLTLPALGPASLKLLDALAAYRDSASEDR